MSQQISFYMTPTDLRAAMKRIADCGDFVILHSRSPQSQPHVLSTDEFEDRGKPWLYFYITRPEFLRSIKMREVPAQGYWAIDSLRSAVIELNRCFYDGSQLKVGRLFFDTSYYDETDQKVAKPESFLAWAKCVLAATKKTLKRDASRSAYIGLDALRETDKGETDKGTSLITAGRSRRSPPE
jgi:hypothetical protein